MSKPWPTLRAYPTLLKIGFLEAFAYRAEFLVWMLTTTMPLIMLGLMRAVVAGPDGGSLHGRHTFDAGMVNAYYLATLIVRQLSASWIVWEMVREIREGSLALRLLRPIHPLVAFSAQSVSGTPMRLLVAVPVVLLAMHIQGGEHLFADGAHIGLFVLAIVGAWLLNFAVSAAIGALALYLESSIGIWELWFGCFMIFSGYLLPLELFPPWFEATARVLPFYFLQALPVEIAVGLRDVSSAWDGVLRQWLWALGALLCAIVVFRRGLRRFSAYGG